MKKLLMLIMVLLYTSTGCKKYLDIVPDNVATLENAFSMRTTAERYLYTCYSYLPDQASMTYNPAFFSGDEEIRRLNTNNTTRILRGEQSVVSPLVNYWDGENEASASMFIALRDCNIFLENVGRVPDLDELERNRWIAEVKFLKAYYHFWLLRLYGPIPLIKDNLPISASIEQVKVNREPVDECFDYIVQLIDESLESLPSVINSEASELGRITKPIALSMKAYILTTAASPLFNGNAQYNGFSGKNGKALFNTTYSADKWVKAAEACKIAIQSCEESGKQLYKYQPPLTQKISDTTKIQMSIRNSVCERWNPEIIWAMANSSPNQVNITPRSWDPTRIHPNVMGQVGVNMKVAEEFYSDNGVPINEDKSYDYSNRYNLRAAVKADRFNISQGYTTANLNYNRENRFYASMGFDGGIWYGQGIYDDTKAYHLEGKNGQYTGVSDQSKISITGYYIKKRVHYQNIIEVSTYTVQWYTWPIMRLADLYLLYAEALNETKGPDDEVYHYVNAVRERAGLKTVQFSWENYSSRKDKYTTKDGLREIIQQERMIELAFEGQRYWDLRRWKRAHIEFSKPQTGWNVYGDNNSSYYKVTEIYKPTFTQRDYFWPIKEDDLLVNKNLVQNPGW